MGRLHNATKAVAHHTTYYMKYCTHLECTRHSGFQTLNVECRTDSRHPLDQPPGTTMETDEDGDR